MLIGIIGIIPILLFLGFLIYLDSFSLISIKRLVISLLYGTLVCGIMFSASLLHNFGSIVVVFEEILKFTLLVVLIKRGKVSFFIDTAIYGAAIGAGFALAENMIYFHYNEMPLADMFYRGFGTAIMHAGLTAISGVILLTITKGDPVSQTDKNPYAFAVLAILPAINLHQIHNSFLVSPLVSLIIIVIGISLILILLFSYNEKLIHKWMENSMSNEIELYQAIQNGEFSQTNSGKYLLKVKDKFSSECFFDMIVYVGLFLEISIVIKRNLMLKELDLEIPEKETIDLRDKIKELSALRKNIGESGLIVLKPIVDYSRIKNLIELS